MGAAGQGDIFDDLLCRFDGELFNNTVSAARWRSRVYGELRGALRTCS
jgi:hypothetical protein